jgi:hypothetical protein
MAKFRILETGPNVFELAGGRLRELARRHRSPARGGHPLGAFRIAVKEWGA